MSSKAKTCFKVKPQVKKKDLPPGWIEKVSKKHPDRIFYFNVDTGQSTWDVPSPNHASSDSDNPMMPRNINFKLRKRKLDDVQEEDKSSDDSRIKLKAKKAVPSSTSGTVDTPAMKLYREKMLQRKEEIAAKKGGSKNALKSAPFEKIVPKRSTRRSSTETTVSELSANSQGSTVKRAAVTKKMTEQQLKSEKILKVRRAEHFSTVKKTKSTPEIIEIPKTYGNRRAVTRSSLAAQTSPQAKLRGILKTPTRKSDTFANDRLKELQDSLTKDKTPVSPRKRPRLPSTSDESTVVSAPEVELSKLPNLKDHHRKNAYSRLCALEDSINRDSLIEIRKLEESNRDKENDEESAVNDRIIKKLKKIKSFDDQMDWEPIEEEKILMEVQSARFQVCENFKNRKEVSNSSIPLDVAKNPNCLYMVIDTNVLLSDLKFVEKIRDSNSEVFGRPFLVIPWTVLQELDYIKDDNNNSRSQHLKNKARKAIDFLKKHFSSQHPRFLGQTASDVQQNKETFAIECPDDEILQTCLQIQSAKKSVVLVTFDKNLCNKAMFHDLATLGKDEPLEKIDFLKAAEATDEFLSNSLHIHMQEKDDDDVSIIRKELLVSEDLMEEAKAVMKSFMSEIVSKEMENLYGKTWEKYVIIRPPWSITCVLKCALKHWMAAVSESFYRRGETTLKEVQTIVTTIPTGGRKLKDVLHFLSKCSELIEMVMEDKHQNLKELTFSSLDTLKQRCQSALKEITVKKFEEIIGKAKDEDEEKTRANLAFSCFEEIYAFARDTCGITAEMLGMQCSFLFNKSNPSLPAGTVSRINRDVCISVNRLIQVFGLALDKIRSEADANDAMIIALFEALNNFSADFTFEHLPSLSPLDVYCCIKWRKEELASGLHQLQELSIHFCRMSNFQTSD